MDLIFTNGTSLQKLACRTALNSLINLPLDRIQFKLTVEFTPDPLASSHNEFAATTTLIGSGEALTKIASIAPNWPIPWDGIQFLQETMAHEFGHALYGSLPEGRRLEIAMMFGASDTSPETLHPAGSAWENRIGEGIAETFKDAFLPPDLRRYFNRTHHKLPISDYPRFREIVRQGVAEMEAELGEGEGELENLEVDLIESLQDDLNNPESDATYESRASAVQDIRVPTNFNYEMTVPRAMFPANALGSKAELTISGHIQFALRVIDADTEEVIHFARGAWLFGKVTPGEHDPLIWDDGLFQFRFAFPDPPNVEESDDASEGGENHWNLYAEEANDLGIPDFTITHSFSVAAGKTIAVEAWALLYVFVPIPEEPEFPLNEIEPELLKEMVDLMPHLIYKEAAVPVEPPELPQPSIEPESLSQSAWRQAQNRVSSQHVG
jgi:hypothetical protein